MRLEIPVTVEADFTPLLETELGADLGGGYSIESDSEDENAVISWGDQSAFVTKSRVNELLNPPGVSGDSDPWEGWSHVSQNVKEVPGRVA